MITISSNLGTVFGSLTAKMRTIATGDNKDKMLRTMATTIVAEQKYRVHKLGKKTDGGQIGTYRNPYLRLRQKKYNRTADTNMIFSLTRQMENDYGIVSSDAVNGYGVGFKNDFNADKAKWLQDGTVDYVQKEHFRTVKGKRIKVKAHNVKGHRGFGRVYDPSTTEIQMLKDVAQDFIDSLVKQNK